MSITELRLVPQHGKQSDCRQPDSQVQQPNTLDRARTINVSHEQLTTVYEDVRGVSRQLHTIEDLSELDWCDLSAMMRRIHHATEALAAMLEKGAVTR